MVRDHLIIAPPYKDETQGQSGLMEALIKSFLEQRYYSSERIMYEGDTESNLLKVLLTPHWLTLSGCGECPGDWCRGGGDLCCRVQCGGSLVPRSHSQGYYHYLLTLQQNSTDSEYGSTTGTGTIHVTGTFYRLSISLRLLTICYAARYRRCTFTLLLLSHAV